MFELSPSDGRKSFYGKAKVLMDDDDEYTLFSYDTPVARIRKGVYEDLDYDHHSPTTNRHVKSFKKQFGIESACGKGSRKNVESARDPYHTEVVNGQEIEYYNDVPDIAYECAEIIADEIRERGIMHFTEIEDRVHEISGLDWDTIIDIELEKWVESLLGYNGIYSNLSDGDFFTEEYAEKHPEVTEE